MPVIGLILIFRRVLQDCSNYAMPLIGQILIFVCILQVLSKYPLPLIAQTVDSCLYFYSLEQLCDSIDRSDHLDVLVFRKS